MLKWWITRKNLSHLLPMYAGWAPRDLGMGQGDAGKCADPSFSGSAVDFGLLLKGLDSHLNRRLRWRESAGLQVQGFLFSEYPVEVGSHPGFELGIAFICRWHFSIRRVRRPQGKALPDPEAGPEHGPHGHPHLAGRRLGQQRPGPLTVSSRGASGVSSPCHRPPWGLLQPSLAAGLSRDNSASVSGRPGAWLLAENPYFRN